MRTALIVGLLTLLALDVCQSELRTCTQIGPCLDGPNPGECVSSADVCDGGNEYITDDDCGLCTCCKTCEPDDSCACKNGICVNPTQVSGLTYFPHDLCPEGYRHFMEGNCGTDDYICCVLRP
ncbi:uncharacterized protein LOC126986694 [Eriocheir sinensis]|uniref:uncharacterized protein LOC126986694 n=1 Tax=Eriocheir sinensis TaxID=95602 RepID=UPI0021C8DC49|nr:uncharacterized protein LOC126986694 [Eriocheir sinensis]XP_050699016.1 uncharacterized protein LOC126986694 [Eriocheir sinensis]